MQTETLSFPLAPPRDLAFGIAWPAPVDFGVGASARLPELLTRWHARRVLVLTDQGLNACGLVPRIVDAMRATGLQVAVYDGVQPNPAIQGVREAHALWRSSAADTLVAIGGGSVIDSAKVLAVLAASDASADDVLLQADAALVRTPPPFVVVPTTSGTGSESTTAGLVKDADGRKRLMRSLRARPCQIVLDPALTLTVPRGMTAATGFDVLMHALGALGTTIANPVGEALACDALARGVRHLPEAVENGQSLPARSEMMLASYLAGLAIMMNGCDAIHGLCTPLESVVDRPHGLVLSATFPEVMRFNLGTLQDRYAQAARRCGFAATDTPDAQAAENLVQGLLALRSRIGLDTSLRALGITADDLAALPQRALDSRATQINARPLSRDDITALYARMFA